MRVVVPLPMVNKANTYQVRFHPIFWKIIEKIARGFRSVHKKSPYWIGPSDEAVNLENVIAYYAKQSLAEDTASPVRVDIWVPERFDADAVKVVLDGIEKSGRIKNDRQVQVLTVYKLPIKNKEFKFDITLI